MIFVVSHYRDADVIGINNRVLVHGIDVWSWTLHRGTERALGAAVCQSPCSFDSEAEARRDVADVRRSFGGLRFVRVITLTDPLDSSDQDR